MTRKIKFTEENGLQNTMDTKVHAILSIPDFSAFKVQAKAKHSDKMDALTVMVADSVISH